MPTLQSAMRTRRYPKPDTLVTLLKQRKDLMYLMDEGWYRIPVKSAPKALSRVKFLAFYQSRDFGDDSWRIQYYGRKARITQAKRIDLLPHEVGDRHRDTLYYRIEVKNLKRLAHPIPSKRERRILFVQTTLQKLLNATEINDLYHGSPLEDKLWEHLKTERIEAERQYQVIKEETGRYFLDFHLPCHKQNIAVECDGDKWHIDTERAVEDNERQNYLEASGWHVLRYSTKQLRNPRECVYQIKKAINQLDGLVRGEETDRFEIENSDGTTQLELFNSRSAEDGKKNQ